jgi:hypothetical protein
MVTRGFYQRDVKKLLKSSHTAGVGASPLLPYVDRTALVAPKELLRLGIAYGGWIIPVDAGLTADSMCYSAGVVKISASTAPWSNVSIAKCVSSTLRHGRSDTSIT